MMSTHNDGGGDIFHLTLNISLSGGLALSAADLWLLAALFLDFFQRSTNDCAVELRGLPGAGETIFCENTQVASIAR